ncbi:GNAT family N-acetyltransferase [Rhizobium sp. CC-YZS058]|uniref:GNAT family N-acetyltransferase n=1 Tax=Rhizobium sp. CC-YZS058 TaxID=3042153 RepID=UPI002B05762C|nr:GNAT family N-acetyltransferase [Rhizobium sp. CC-YZS058]MEA3534908.1 GNAT family N-acetyltransferase [Rhizobium sp. CC-YZS058]
MPAFKLSPATTPADFAAAETLLSAFAAWDAAQGAAVGLSPDTVISLFHGDTAESLARKFGAPDTQLILARQNDRPIGCLGITPFDETRMELHSFYVDPSARGLGVGTALIRAVVDFAAATARPTVLVQTTVYMEGAIRLYEAAGFVPCPPFREIPDIVRKTERFFARPA